MILSPLLAEFKDYDTLIFWIAIGTICVVPSLGYYIHHWRKSELDAELKRDMIARGMSAEEIERVLAAGTGGKSNED
jgi:hypothetical protein